MRVLAVLTFQPWPVRSGITRRLDAIVHALNGAFDLSVVVVAEPGAPEQVPDGVRVARVTRTQSRGASVRELLRDAGRWPVTAAFYRRPEAVAAVRAAASDADVVFTHGFGGAALCAGLENHTVLDADTIDPQTYRRMAHDARGLKRLQWAVDVPLGARWHRRHLPAYAAVTVVSKDDAAQYRDLAPSARLVVVGNGVELPKDPRPDPGGSSLLFVGDLSYAPNRAGVEWFARESLPLLDARLRVVGGGPFPVLPGVEAAGFVPDLATEWARATLCIVPLRAGGGTRLKVLEAFANGVPVISTAMGVEGLDAVPGVHYLRAETPGEFATQVSEASRDRALRERLAGEARRLVGAYTWDRTTRPLVDTITSL